MPAQNVTAGSWITVYAITRDGQGNFVANPPASWSLQNITPNVVSGDLVASGDTQSATFTGHLVGSANIQTVAGGFTGQSGQQTVIPGAVSAAHSTISPPSATKTANGTSTQVITVQARDANNNNRTTGGDTVLFSATAGTMNGTTPNGDGTYTTTWTAPSSVGSGSATVTATLGGTAVGGAGGANGSCVITLTSALPTPIFTGVTNKAIAYGTAAITLTGTVSQDGTYPAESDAISATINGQAVAGTFTNDTGGFLINYNDVWLATAAVGEYPITYSYAGGANLNSAEDATTTLTVLTKASGTLTLPGYLGPAPVVVDFVAEDGSTVLGQGEATFAASGPDVTYAIGVPAGTTSLYVKPRFYLMRKIDVTDPFTESTVTIDLGSFVGGDANNDNKVNGDDYAAIRALWGQMSNTQYDLNGDGKVDASDYFPDLNGDGVIDASDYQILKDGWYQQGVFPE